MVADLQASGCFEWSSQQYCLFVINKLKAKYLPQNIVRDKTMTEFENTCGVELSFLFNSRIYFKSFGSNTEFMSRFLIQI